MVTTARAYRPFIRVSPAHDEAGRPTGDFHALSWFTPHIPEWWAIARRISRRDLDALCAEGVTVIDITD